MPRPARGSGNRGSVATVSVGAAILVAAALPLLSGSQFLVNAALLTAYSAYLGGCWNLAGGFGGLTSFGHVAFFGLGAYAAAILQTRYGVSPWAALPLAALLGAGAGWIVGAAAFRAGLRGSYFALVTLAVAEALRVVANSVDLTNGGLGILVPLRPGWDNFQFTDRRASYAFVLLLLGAYLLAAAWLRHSRFGAQLAAVREAEDAARALGIDPVRTKSAALALSGGMTALGGVLYMQTYLYVDPSIAFGPERSVEMLLVPMIGGAGTVLGPVLGAVALHVVADAARSWIPVPGFAPMLYGIALLLIVAFLPGGIARLAPRPSSA